MTYIQFVNWTKQNKPKPEDITEERWKALKRFLEVHPSPFINLATLKDVEYIPKTVKK